MLLEEEFPELSFEGHMEISQKNVGTCVPARAHACVCKEPVPRQSGCEQGVSGEWHGGAKASGSCGNPAKGLLAFILWAVGTLRRIKRESSMIRKMTLVAEWRMDCRKAGLEAGGGDQGRCSCS